MEKVTRYTCVREEAMNEHQEGDWVSYYEHKTLLEALKNELNDRIEEKIYLDWVKQAGLPPLTRTQYEFAQWLLREDNAAIISQVGDLETIFSSVRKWLRK